jgi:hypothetical protein
MSQIPYSIRGGRSIKTIAGLDDTTITNLQNQQILKYDSASEKWVNVADGGGGGGSANIYQLGGLTWNNLKDNEVIRRSGSTSAEGAGITLQDAVIVAFPQNVYKKTISYFNRASPSDIQFGAIDYEYTLAGYNQRIVPYRLLLTSSTDGLYLHYDNTLNNTNVGVNIQYPEEKFEVDGSIQIDGATSTSLKFKKSGVSPHALCEIKGILENANGGNMEFYTKLNGGIVTKKLTISETGAIGIGTTPLYGNAGQFLRSGSSSAQPFWHTLTLGSIDDVTLATPTTVTFVPANAIQANLDFRQAIITSSGGATNNIIIGGTTVGTGNGTLAQITVPPTSEGLSTGVTSYVAINPINFTTSFTIELYFKLPSVSGTSQNYNAVFSAYDGGIASAGASTNNIGIERYANTNKLQFYTRHSGDSTVQTTADVDALNGSFGHIIVIHDSTQSANNCKTVYVNGQIQSLVYTAVTGGFNFPSGTRTNNVIGRTPYGDSGVEDVKYIRFYNRVLTASEISTLYQYRDTAGSSTTTPGVGDGEIIAYDTTTSKWVNTNVLKNCSTNTFFNINSPLKLQGLTGGVGQVLSVANSGLPEWTNPSAVALSKVYGTTYYNGTGKPTTTASYTAIKDTGYNWTNYGSFTPANLFTPTATNQAMVIIPRDGVYQVFAKVQALPQVLSQDMYFRLKYRQASTGTIIDLTTTSFTDSGAGGSDKLYQWSASAQWITNFLTGDELMADVFFGGSSGIITGDLPNNNLNTRTTFMTIHNVD